MDATRPLTAVVAAALALLVALVTVVGAASPAAADTGVEVEAGYVDGQIVPGRPVPVRVQVRADQLVTGTLTVVPYTLGQPGDEVSTAVEVAGGSVKDYLVVVPTVWDGTLGPSEMRVTLRTGDDTVESTAALSWSGEVEVVGLVPGLVSQAPDPVTLDRDLGRAVFAPLDAQALATPGALGPLGSIVAGPDGLAALPPEAQGNVLEWVEDGGQLLVDAPPGTPLAGVPEAWQPGGARAAAGAGWVRLTDGAAARGQWQQIIEPTRQFGSQELSSGGMCCFSNVADTVAGDAGLRIPDVGWLLGFLVAYVAIVGPLTFVVLRRARRTGLAWVAVPLVAVLFTGVAYTAGSSLRSDARAAHGSVVQASPLGDRTASYVGLVSRDGSDPTALFPEGWQAGGLDRQALSNMAFDDMGMPDTLVTPVALTGDDGRPGVRLPLSSGDFGMVTGRGRVDGDSQLAVSATAAGDGTVTGTVANTSELDLEQVIVVVAGRVADVGGLAGGAEAEWSVDTAGHDPNPDPWAATEHPWFGGIDPRGMLEPDDSVNYAVYAAEIGADVDAYPPGVAVAAGWTTDWTPPVDVGSELAGGRTAIVARSPVTAAPGTVPAAAVRREFVRGAGATRFDPPIEIADWGSAVGAVARFTLPEGTDPATPLMLDAAAGVAQAEVWDGRAWVAVELTDDDPAAGGADDEGAAAGGEVPPGGDAVVVERLVVEELEPAAATIVAPAPPADVAQPEPGPVILGGPGLDPFGPPRHARLPAGAIDDGSVYVRVAMSPDIATRVVLQVRGVS